MIWAYAIFWNLLYLIIFGPFVLLFTLIFELTKFWFLGKFTAWETLAVYPMIFLFGIVSKNLLFDKSLKKYELIAFSLASSLGSFFYFNYGQPFSY